MKRIKKFFLNSFIVCSSLVVGLVLFESFLYFENKSKPVDRIDIEIYGYKYPFIKSDSTANPLTLMDEKRELLVVGDSFVEGVVCASDDETFPSHLQRMLKGQSDVVNLGIGDKNPADYIDFLDHLSISKGDVSLVTLYDNDLHFSQRNCTQVLRQSENYEIYVPKFCKTNGNFKLKSNLTMAQKINNRIRDILTVRIVKEALFQIPFIRKYFYRTALLNQLNDFDAEENRWIRSSLKVIKDIMREKGGEAIFTYYPNTNRISSDDERHKIWLNFINYVNKNDNVAISDPYPFFIENSINSSMVWSLTDRHPSCEAHKLMAEFTLTDLKAILAKDVNDR